MSDALRPSSLFTTAPPATVPTGVLGTLPNPPPAVTQLPGGTTLRGTVVGQDNKGHILVRTDLGTLAVSTKANLPPGSEVVLQIRSSGAQLHVLLMQTNAAAQAAPGGTAQGTAQGAAGSSPGNAAPRGLAPGPGTLPTPPGVGAPPPDKLALGQSIRAILQTTALRPASTGSATTGPAGLPGGSALDPATMAAVARLAPGSQIMLRIIAVEAPPGTSPGTSPGSPAGITPQSASIGAPPTASAGATPGPIAGQLQAASPPVPSQASALPVSTPTGTSVPALSGAAEGVPTPSSPSPPGGQAGQAPSSTVATAPINAGAAYTATQTPPSSSPHAGQGGAPVAAQASPPSPGTGQITGVVTATTNAGHPVLQTPIGTLTLEVRASLPTGSRVIFEWTPGALAREPASLPASFARAWPEIEEVVRVLHEAAASGAAAPPGDTIIPQPGPRLASGLLFFLAALNGGDMGRWLGGQAIQTLKAAGRGNLLARLGQDFGQLSRQVESGGTDWRLFLIPLLDETQVQQIRFFERHGSHGQGSGDDQKDGGSTRFVLEIELSRLGNMQIDGLVRDRRFDLVLRTRRPLPDVMRHDIIEIFTDANDAAGFVGTIGFQASRDWRFMPINDGITASAETGLVI